MAEETEPLIKIMIPFFVSVGAIILAVIPIFSPKLQFPSQLIVSALTALTGSIIFLFNGTPKSGEHIISNDIKPVFLEWEKIPTIPLTDRHPGLDNISVPLYINIIEEIRTKDTYNEALPHLHDKAYPTAKKIYDNLSSLEENNNNLVSTFIHELENSITSAFSYHDIRERAHEPEFYSLNFMIRALKDASLSGTWQQLNENEQSVNGVRYTDFILGKISFARCRTDKKDVVKQLINIERDKTPDKMRKIENNIRNMNVLLNDFREEIKKIIHDADRSGLMGECIYEEQEWKFFHCKRFPLRGGQ